MDKNLKTIEHLKEKVNDIWLTDGVLVITSESLTTTFDIEETKKIREVLNGKRG